MNIITLCGRLVKDIELKYGKEKAYGKFTLAVNRPRVKDEVDFINCVAFGKSAEILGEYVRKGGSLVVVGRLHYNQYVKDGEKRTSWDVMVDSFDLVGGKSEQKEEKKSELREYVNTSESSDDDYEDSFPF